MTENSDLMLPTFDGQFVAPSAVLVPFLHAGDGAGRKAGIFYNGIVMNTFGNGTRGAKALSELNNLGLGEQVAQKRFHLATIPQGEKRPRERDGVVVVPFRLCLCFSLFFSHR